MTLFLSWRGSSLPTKLESPGSVHLMPKTISMLISVALGMLLSDIWIDWSVLLFERGHCIRFTWSLKFMPERLMQISFDEVSMILIKCSRNSQRQFQSFPPLIRLTLCSCGQVSSLGRVLQLRFRYWIYLQFSLITSIRSVNYRPWMLMLYRLSSQIYGMFKIILFKLSISTNSLISRQLSLSLVSRLLFGLAKAYRSKLRSCLVELTRVILRSLRSPSQSGSNIFSNSAIDRAPNSLLTQLMRLIAGQVTKALRIEANAVSVRPLSSRLISLMGMQGTFSSSTLCDFGAANVAFFFTWAMFSQLFDYSLTFLNTSAIAAAIPSLMYWPTTLKIWP